MDDTISRQAAIETVWKITKNVPTMAIRARDALKTIPSAQQESSFITWLLDAIWDDEMWELNWQAFPEIVCRKLAKLGYLMEKDGEYERLD